MKTSRLLLCIVLLLLVVGGSDWTFKYFRRFGPIGSFTIATQQKPSALVRSLRPNYPYSVIAGGAYTPNELRYSDDRDAIVRAHYADFNMKQAKLVQLTEDRFQYASYRMRNQIYWTHKKLRIPKGELLLTDGNSFARARCGNRLSEEPHKEVSTHEPPGALLSLPPVRPDMLPKLELAQAPALGEIYPARSGPVSQLPTNIPAPSPITVAPPGANWPPFVPAVPIIPGGPPGVLIPAGPPTSPPVVPPLTPPEMPPTLPPPGTPQPVSTVPEPSTVYLFLVALLISVWGLTRMFPRTNKKG